YIHISSITFFFIVPSTTETSTLSLHDALPIFGRNFVDDRRDSSQFGVVSFVSRTRLRLGRRHRLHYCCRRDDGLFCLGGDIVLRSEEHTSELQSRGHLVCRLLLEKKN